MSSNPIYVEKDVSKFKAAAFKSEIKTVYEQFDIGKIVSMGLFQEQICITIRL